MAVQAMARVVYSPQRVTKKRPCTICGRDHYCGYDPRAGVAFCTKVENNTGARYGEWGWVHHVDATPQEYSAHLAKTSQPKVELTAEQAAARDVLYAALAQHCRLSTEDFIDLTSRRKLTAAQVKRHGYFTYPEPDVTRHAAAHLESQVAGTVGRRWNKEHPDLLLEHALQSLPGIYRQTKRGKWGGTFYNLMPVKAGNGDIFNRLAIPVRNERGETIAVRIRIPGDRALGREKKLLWLSSSSERQRGGTSSGAPIHVAQPEVMRDHRVWVTEGEIKANIAADALGAVVLSLPGYQQGAELPEMLDRLKAAGHVVDGVVMALDQNDAKAETRKKVDAASRTYAATLARLGYTVHLATWADAKGIDDLLVAGGQPTITPFAAPRQRGLVPMAPVSYGADSVLASMAEAEFQLEDIAKQILPAKWPRGVKALATHIVMATPGVGKSHHVFSRVDALDRADAWPQVWNHKTQATRDVRVLILFDDTKILAEQTEKHFGAIWATDTYQEGDNTKTRLVWDYAKQGRPTFFVMEGRNAAPQSGSYCQNSVRVGEVGERRGLTMVDVCQRGGDMMTDNKCPFFQNCEVSGYLAAKKASKRARIVCACKAAYLNESKELEDFDLVIMDEDTVQAFLDGITVTTGDVDQWRKLLAERDREGSFPELERFLAWMQEASNHAKAHGEGVIFPAMPHFRATAPADALDVLQGARAAAQRNTGNKSQTIYRAVCEEIRQNDRIIPLRALHDITQGILNEWPRPEGADTRLRFTDAGTITYRYPRLGLIMKLFARRVAILDATGDIAALQRIFTVATSEMATTPDFKVHHVQVQHTIRLTQISDSLYGRKALGKDGAVKWHAIEETVAAMAKRLGVATSEVARLTYKLFDPNDATSDTAGDDPFITGHYGLDNKATNRFAGCRMLVTIGNYLPNIGEITAVVEAWRFSPAPRKTGKHIETVCYPGKSQGVERPVMDDEDVQHAICHAAWAQETQALGRMRDVRRPGEVLHWIRFNRNPYIPPGPEYQAVPVATLTPHNHLRSQLGLDPIETFSAKRRAPLMAQNAQRQAEAEAKCKAAADALTAEGKEITATAIANRAGVNYNRAKTWWEANQAAYAPKPRQQRQAKVDPRVVPIWPATVTAFADRVRWMTERQVDEDTAIAFIIDWKAQQAARPAQAAHAPPVAPSAHYAPQGGVA